MRTLIAAAVTIAALLPATAAGEDLRAEATDAMRRAGSFFAEKVASHGGFVWEYGADLGKRRRGESGDLPKSTNWVQPPGTPSVGEAFLAAYEATGEEVYLGAAHEAGRCLAWGQLASGGWDYRIEHDLARNRNLYHHLVGRPGEPVGRLRNTTTFDDDNTQSATRFLMDLALHVEDPAIESAVERALECFLSAQCRLGAWDGAWPQRFPPPRDYGAFPTFNDHAMSDCVRTVLLAYRRYHRPVFLACVRRALDFYLRSQLPDPQGGWAQQYDADLRPAWARKFEPPAVSGAESAGNLRLLLDMHLELDDERYLAAAGRAVEWFEESRIGGTPERGIWARFYELGTNRPLYFTKAYELVTTDDDLPTHYSFKGNWGVDREIRRYREILEKGRDAILARTPDPEERARNLEPRVRRILASLDESGRWVEKVKDGEETVEVITSRTFVRNMGILAEYVSLCR